MIQLIAQSNDDRGVYLGIAQLVIMLAIFISTIALGMSRRPNDDRAVAIYKEMPAEQFAKLREGSSKQARKWIIGIIVASLYLIGRQIYQIVIASEVLIDRSFNILLFTLFMFVPSVVNLILLPKPDEATNRHLTLGSKLMSTAALVMVVWGALIVVTKSGPWTAAVWQLLIAGLLFFAATSIAQIRVFRRYDETR